MRPTCPICRNDVEFNGQNLGAYLDAEQASSSPTLTQEEMGFFQSIRSNLRQKYNDGWSHVTWDNVQYAGGLIACFGWGFYTGYNHDRMFYPVDIYPLSTHNRIAQGVGWFVGIIAREIRRKRRDRDNR